MTSNVATSTLTGHTNGVDSLFGDEKLETIIEETDQTDSDVTPERSPSIDANSTSETMLVGNVDKINNPKKIKKTKENKTTTDNSRTTEAMLRPPPALPPEKTTHAFNNAAVANRKSEPSRALLDGPVDVKVDPCVGIDGTHVKKPLQRTIFSKLAEEKFKVRRIQRKPAKPTSFKDLHPKTTKTSDLRQRLIQNEDVVAHSSISEEYMKKYKKLPFKRFGVLKLCYEKLRDTFGKVRKRSISKSRSTSKRRGKSRKRRNKQKRAGISRDERS